jgi:serine/threonine protein kinase/WD40 repeat protein
MTDLRRCPQCDTPLPPDAPDGVCPNCILALALDRRPDPGAKRALRIKCPHCGNAIQVVQTDVREVTCQSCGSSFHIEPNATTTYSDGQLPEAIGKFQVLQLVGRGAFGSVYKARDPELDRIVAIKVPRAGYFSSPEQEERFLREARSAARLSHPGIVPVHEIAHAQGLPYLVSDYVDALTLADVLTGPRPSFAETAELVARVAEALDYAHRAGIIHRDIKPSNILIDGAGLPHLTDFGLARRDEGEITVTLEGQILGTPAYMSPEQAGGQAVDGRSDVYSFGVVLYEMLTGELPFRGNQRMLLHQVVHDEPRPPRRLNDRIPRDLETICLKAMAKQPARRYASAGALAEDLRRYLKREPIKARPVGTAERLWRWSRRNPIVAALSASLLIVLIAGLISVTLLWLQAEDRRQQAVLAGIAEGKATDLGRKHLARARWNLYVSQIQVVRQELQEGHVSRARQLLDSLRPAGAEADLRGFEWHYLSCLCRISLPVLELSEPVHGIAYSPDGRRLAVIQRDAHAVSVWDAVTGERRWQQVDPNIQPFTVSFSRDGRRLACGGYDWKVHFWDVQTGQPILPAWEMPTQPKAISFSPAEDQVAVGEQDGLTLRDAANGKEIARMPMPIDRVHAVCYSRDGRRLAALRNGAVIVWDVPTRKVFRTVKANSMVGLALSPDGRFLAQRGPNTQITVHDLQAEQSFFLGAPGVVKGVTGVNALAWSPDGSRLAAAPAYDGLIRVWDVVTRNEELVLRGHDASVYTLAFSPDGLRLATTSLDGTVRIWSVSGDGSLGLSGASRIESPDGRRYYTWAQGTAKAWDAASHQEVLALEPALGPLRDLMCSPDGALLAGVELLGGNEPNKKYGGARWQVTLWDAASGRRLRSLPVSFDPIGSIVFSPDGRSVAVTVNHQTRQQRVEPHAKSTLVQWVVTSFKATIRIWEVATGRERIALDCPYGSVRQADFTPDGRHVLATAVLPTKEKDASVALLEASTGRPVWRLHLTSLPGNVGPAVALSPDGRQTAVAVEDRVLVVLDTETGKKLRRLATRGFPTPAFSADGSRLIAQQSMWGGAQREVRIWDAATGEELLTIGGSGPEFHLPRRGRDGRTSWKAHASDMAHWDVSSQTAEVRRNRDAALLVHQAFARSPWRDDVLDELRRVAVVDEAVRREALTQAQRRTMDANGLNDAAWRFVSQPTTAAGDLRRAAAMAEEAARQQPQNGFFLNTLGIAYYRQGHHEQALPTLLRSEKLNASRMKSAHPADLAFLAMTAQKLGRTTEARQYLERLRTTIKLPTWGKNEEALRFLREAEDVVKK